MANPNQQMGLLGKIFGDKYTQSQLGGILGSVGNAAQSFTQSPSGQYFAARASGAKPGEAMLGSQRAQAYQTAMAYQEEQRQREAEEYQRQQEAAAQAEAQRRINNAIFERISEGGTSFLGGDRQQQVAGLLGRGVDPKTIETLLGKEQSGGLKKVFKTPTGGLLGVDNAGTVVPLDMNGQQVAMPTGPDQSPSYGLQPFYTTDEQGNLIANQLNNRGGIQPVQLPKGQSPLSPYEKAYGAESGKGVAKQETVGSIEKNKVLGKAEGEAVVNQPKAAMKQAFAEESVKEVLTAIDTATNLVGMNTAGWGSLLKDVPSSEAKGLQQALLTIKANIGFDRLQAMRDASPTGGALGQVAIQELYALQNSITSLDQSLDSATLKKNLDAVKTHYTNWLNIMKQYNSGAQSNNGDWSIVE